MTTSGKPFTKKYIIFNMQRLTFLGTGAALATKCYNTCFTLQTSETLLLTDAGGGNGILSQLEKACIPTETINSMFITHVHTDHFLGSVWMLRIAMQRLLSGRRTLPFHVYSHDKVLSLLDLITRMTLPQRFTNLLGDKIVFHNLHDGDTFTVGDLQMKCFDIHSTKEKQFGYSTILPDGQQLTCLGDEPYNTDNAPEATRADWLLCEAFCLEKDKTLFKPHEKHHSTALEAARNAAQLEVKNLVLYHTVDNELPDRRKAFTDEAMKAFNGTIFVPDDLEVIPLSR